MNLDGTKSMRSEHSPSGHPLNALIFPDQKCDVKMGCLPKRRKKKHESKGMSLNGNGLNNITFCFLKAPFPPDFQLLQHCRWYAVCTTLLGRIFSFFEFFSFRPSVIDIVNVYLYFLQLSFLLSLFLLHPLPLLFPCDWHIYKNTSPSASLWAMYENQPTLFNTCLRGRISVHVGGAVGVGYGLRVVEGVDRQRWQLQRLH